MISLSSLLSDAHLIFIDILLKTLEELLQLRFSACLVNQILQVYFILAHIFVVRVEEHLGNLKSEIVKGILL